MHETLIHPNVPIRDTFMVRQPLFDAESAVAGYYLLSRPGHETAPLGGLSACPDHVTGARRAFTDISWPDFREPALTDCPIPLVTLFLPRLEGHTARIDDVAAWKRTHGSLIAAPAPDAAAHEDLALLADLLYVDGPWTCAEELERLAAFAQQRRLPVVARHVDTVAQFQEARQAGVSYFHGAFYTRPLPGSRRTLTASELLCMQVFKELARTDLDFGRLETLIKRDVSFSYRLLRFVNSAAFGMRTKISAIRQALVMLGAREVTRWLSMIALRDLGRGKPDELMLTCLVRARLSEQLAVEAGLKGRASDLFLLGMFSAIDALVDRPVDEVLDGLPLEEDVKAALLGEPNRLRDVFDMVLAYERGDWDGFAGYAARLRMDERCVPPRYVDALEWAGECLPEKPV